MVLYIINLVKPPNQPLIHKNQPYLTNKKPIIIIFFVVYKYKYGIAYLSTLDPSIYTQINQFSNLLNQ